MGRATQPNNQNIWSISIILFWETCLPGGGGGLDNATVRWVPWSEDFNLSASYRPLWSAIGAEAPKIPMHLSKFVQRQEFLTFADLLGDLSLNISLGLLWDNIVASYQRAP